MSTNIRTLVSTSSRILGNAGFDDFIWGHSAARDPDGRGAWLKRSGIGLSETTPDDVQLVARDGTVVEGAAVEGGGNRHIEYSIHTEILAARPDVGGVVHMHPPQAVAFAAAGSELRPVSHQGSMFAPPSPPVYSNTTDLIRTPELGAEVATALGNHNALFLLHHGIVAVGPDLQTATVTALLLEEACEQQLRTVAHGGVRSWTNDDEAREKKNRIYSPKALDQVWEYLVRKLRDIA